MQACSHASYISRVLCLAVFGHVSYQRHRHATWPSSVEGGRVQRGGAAGRQTPQNQSGSPSRPQVWQLLCPSVQSTHVVPHLQGGPPPLFPSALAIPVATLADLTSVTVWSNSTWNRGGEQRATGVNGLLV